MLNSPPRTHIGPVERKEVGLLPVEDRFKLKRTHIGVTLLTIMGEKVMQSHDALNKDVERWCDLQERGRGTVLTRLHLSIVNRVCSLHSDVNSLLHGAVSSFIKTLKHSGACKLF